MPRSLSTLEAVTMLSIVLIKTNMKYLALRHRVASLETIEIGYQDLTVILESPSD